MKILLISLLLSVIVPVCAFGQPQPATSKTPVSDDKKKQSEAENEMQLRRERDIQNLVLSANTLPIEIAADVLFNVLDTKLVKDVLKRRSITEDLFRRATEAKEPFNLAFYGGNVDTRPGYRSNALRELNIDRLTIQLRAIRLMLAIDKQRARQMFREIPDLKLPAQTCDDVLTYLLSDYYKTLKDIVDQTFDIEARQRKEHIYFAASYIDTIDSPSQITPVIEFIRSTKGAPADHAILVSCLTASLRKIGTSPRGFALSIDTGLISGMRYLIPIEAKDRNTDATQLSKAFRQYLVHQLSGTQCTDSVFGERKETAPTMLEFVNPLFDIPLTEDEIKPEKTDPRPKVFLYWKKVKSSKLLTNIKNLRFGNTENGLSLEERSKPEWQQEMMKFLEQMEDWKPEDEETEADYLHQKSVIYNGLVSLAPPGHLLSNVLRAYALFLRDSRMQKENPGQWLYYMKRVMRTGKELKGKENDDFINTLNNSGNQIFALYIEMDRLESTGVPKPAS